MRWRRALVVLFVATIVASACASDSDEQTAGAEATESPTTREPDTRQPDEQKGPSSDVKRPAPGDYVYDFIALEGADVPEGTRLTEKVSFDGDAYTIRISNTRNSNTRVLQLMWEAKRVVMLSDERIIRGQRSGCRYDPALEILRIPIGEEDFGTQTTGTGGCHQTVETTVVGQENVEDANGRSWPTWLIETSATVGGQTEEARRWFSPELGREIRIEEGTADGARTAQVLRSYPNKI